RLAQERLAPRCRQLARLRLAKRFVRLRQLAPGELLAEAAKRLHARQRARAQGQCSQVVLVPRVLLADLGKRLRLALRQNRRTMGGANVLVEGGALRLQGFADGTQALGENLVLGKEALLLE